MQKKEIIILFLFFVLINSCKTDFNTIAPYKEVTVVYGLLDPDPSVKYQYIKINKAFLGEGNALIMAQQKDSINYKPGALVVTLQQVNPDKSVVTYPFDTTTIIPKDSGMFYYPYQLQYRNKTTPLTILQDGPTYNLIIYNSNDKLTLTSSTNVVQRIDSSYFSSPSPSPNVPIKLVGAVPAEYKVLFNAAKNARLYSLVIRFHYTEKNLASQDTTTKAKTIDWDQGTQKSQFLTGEEQISFAFNRSDFYGYIASQLKVNSNLLRYVSTTSQLDFIVTYAGDALSTYFDVNQPSLGIDQAMPEFSNIKNGIGIFSSRTSLTLTRSLDNPSYVELTEGSVTGALFQP